MRSFSERVILRTNIFVDPPKTSNKPHIEEYGAEDDEIMEEVAAALKSKGRKQPASHQK